MYSDRAHADRRRFLVVAPLGAGLLLSGDLLLPGAPGHLLWQSGLALGVAIANLVIGTRVNPRALWAAPLAAVSFAAVLGLNLAQATSLHEALIYMVWFPLLTAYVALIRVRLAVGTTVVIIGALLIGSLACRAPGEVLVAPTASAALCVAVAALVVKGLFRADLMQRETDTLTRLPNRAGTIERGDRAVQEIRSAGHEAVLVLVDINRFHEINDALGHVGGDILLQVIARALDGLTPSPAFVGRTGGDEFALVFRGLPMSAETTARGAAAAWEQAAPAPTVAEATRGRVFARRVLRQIQGPFEICGVEVAVDASVGVAMAPRDGTSMAALLTCADSALLRAKRAGESVGLWDPGITGVRPEEIALFAQLRSAIRQDELVVYYQPLQSAHSGAIVGAEALLRWQHPTRGLLPPGEFLPVIERSPLIDDLTRWVLDEALRQCAAWIESGLHLPVSINLSPRMLVLDDLPTVIVGALDTHGLSSRALTLEITESALVTQPARAATILRQLRAQGVELSLDDFGTGYSSMEILKTLPFSEVKIDRGFVADASGSVPDAAIVRSVIDLGHRLGLRVVGEGIEDERTLSMMIDLGCDLLQGDAVSVPLPAPQMSALLRSRLPTRTSDGSRSHTTPGVATGPSVRADRAVPRPIPSDPGSSIGPRPSSGTPLSNRTYPPAGSRPSNGSRPSTGSHPPNGSRSVRGVAAKGAAPRHATGTTRPGPARPASTPIRPGPVSTPVSMARPDRAPPSSTAPQSNTAPEAGSAPEAGTDPVGEEERLVALRDGRFLRTEPEADDLAVVAARATGCSAATIIFADGARAWTKTQAREGASLLAARCGIGARVLAQGSFIEVQDLGAEGCAPPRPADPGAPLTRPRHYRAGEQIRFAAGIPITAPDGHVLGALTVVDRVPRKLTTQHRAILAGLARQALSLLDARRDATVFALVTGALADLDRLWFARDVERAASLTASTARILLGADETGLLLAEMPGSTIYRVAGQSVIPGVMPISEVGEELVRGSRLLAQAMRMQGPLFVADAGASPLLDEGFAEHYRLGSVLVVPLPREGGMLGAIAARWEVPRGEIDPMVVRALTLLARQSAYTFIRLRAPSGGSVTR